MTNDLITFDQYVQEKGFDNKTVNRFWKYCNQDIPNKETGQIEWWGRDVTNYNDMVGYSEEFDNLFEEFKNINSSRRNNMIKSSITKDEYFNMVKKHKSTNASTPEFRKQELDAITAFPVGTKFAFKEDNSWHDVNTVYEKIDDNVWKITQVINGKVNDEYTKSDDEMRIYISDEFGGNAYPTSYVSGYGSINSSRRNNMIKSAYTREDYDRFDEYGEYIPYKPTEEELAKKDEIKKALDKELAAAFEPDPMDDYAGYDSTSERMDSAVEKVANQFGVDTDFAWECAGELMNEENARQYEEAEWAQNNLKGDEYDKWYRGELDIRDRIHSSRKPIKSSIITPWDTNQVTGTSDEDLGLSAVVDMYGNEFVNVDESTLNELKDTLVRYFDDEAYVRDWNINNPDYQIEDAFEVTDPEEMDVEDLARYFDYEAYGRDIRLEDNMVWDSENQYWVSAHDVDDEELNDDKYIFMRG